MTKKIIYSIVVALLLLTLGFALAACSGEECPPSDVDLSGVTLTGKTLDYNGEAQSLSVSGILPDRVTVEYFGNGVVDAGVHTVTAKFYYNGHYLAGADKTAKITINRVSLADALDGISFPGTKVFYDGNVHSIAVVGNIPDTIRVTYEGNGVSAVGTHTVTAKFNVNETNYYPLADMQATITIEEPVTAPEIPSLAGISMADKTVAFNGEKHGILINGTLPEGVTVEYFGTAQSEIGTYTVVARFFYNGLQIEGADLSANLTITKPSVILSSITLSNKTVDYNGEAQSILISGTLPNGVIVTYEGNGVADAGEYTVTAKFYYKGVYLEGSDKTATLKINKIDVDMSGVSFNNTYIYGDGTAHSIAVNGTLPEGIISVEYEGNGKVGAGVYTVIARFIPDKNHNAPADMTAQMTIVVAVDELTGVEFPDGEFVYDGTPKSIYLEDGYELPLGVSFLGYEGNGMTDVGEYTVEAKFALNGEYSPKLSLTATLTIVKASITVGAKNESYEFTFDGYKKSIGEDVLVWNGEKPDFVTVTATGATERLPGVYTVVYSFAIAPEMQATYNDIEDVRVTMIIVDDTTLASEGLIYGTNTDGTYYVKSYEGNATAVIIPATYNGKAVTTVASLAFANNTTLEYVRIPESVKTIGQSVFRGCTSLEAISLPFIGGSYNSSSEYFGHIFGALSYAGNKQAVPKTLKTVEILSTCQNIPAYAFYGCESIEEIRIGAGVTEIGISAFAGCTSLKSIYIPATVTDIPAAANTYNSPFFGIEGLVIYLEGEVKEGYAVAWNIIDASGATATVKTGYTFEEYLAARAE